MPRWYSLSHRLHGFMGYTVLAYLSTLTVMSLAFVAASKAQVVQPGSGIAPFTTLVGFPIRQELILPAIAS